MHHQSTMADIYNLYVYLIAIFSKTDDNKVTDVFGTTHTQSVLKLTIQINRGVLEMLAK